MRATFLQWATCTCKNVVTLRLLIHVEQYRELGVTTSRRKNSVSRCCCGRMRRAINAFASAGARMQTRKRELEAGRIKSHYPEGAIPAPTGLYPVSRIFPRPCARAGFRSALSLSLFPDRKIFRELCVSFAWVGRPAMKSHQQEFP